MLPGRQSKIKIVSYKSQTLNNTMSKWPNFLKYDSICNVNLMIFCGECGKRERETCRKGTNFAVGLLQRGRRFLAAFAPVRLTEDYSLSRRREGRKGGRGKKTRRKEDGRRKRKQT